jgi:acetyl esterase/lipase
VSANPLGIVLDPAAQAFAEATSQPPFLYQLPPAEGAAAVDEVQSAEIFKPAVDEEWITIEGGPTGSVRARIVAPPGAPRPLPVILYIHGAGWVFGNAHTHDRLVRDLAIGATAAVVFPEYDRAPDAGYPVQIEQSYTVARWVTTKGTQRGLDPSRMAVAGDSVGGNLAIALTLLAKDRGDVSFRQQVEFYPVTSARRDTESYRLFRDGYFLSAAAMTWFFDQYTTDPDDLASILVSPLNATPDELRGLPPALIITGEADVLRDEGEQFAARLREAGVPVANARFGGVVHDFVMLHALHDSEPAKAAVSLACGVLTGALHGRSPAR